MLRASSVSLALAALVLGSCSSGGSSETKNRDAASHADAGSGSVAPSCAAGGAGASTCGSGGSGNESCCTAMTVTGGAFLFGYDGISTSGKSTASMATISPVSLDRYEVTVGRFRAFVAAEVLGWRPAAGSGKHSNLNGGKGLNGGTEGGWDTSWSASLATTTAEWGTNLACETNATWTGSPGGLEEHPINCVDWYEAYAFCIWDGGFLPSEAEWDYTAAGGGDQRVYPWSLAFPPGSTTLDCDHANYTSCGSGTNKVGSESPLGDSKWGHADLAGNVFEWNLDWYAMSYPATCDDCANLTKAEYKVIRGGGFEGASACLLNSLRETSVPDGRSASIGVRCARPPS